LLALSDGADGLFEARRDELEAIQDGWRQTGAAQAKAAVLAAQVHGAVQTAETAALLNCV